jgi:hypothetical protein
MINRNNLSVFLPTKNRPKFLLTCLKSFFDLNLKELWGFVIDKNIRSIEFHKKNGFIISNDWCTFEDKKRHPNLLGFCLKRNQWIGN